MIEQILVKALIEKAEALALIKRIQDALGTAEEGDALVEVASNARKAELELASTYNFDGDPLCDMTEIK